MRLENKVARIVIERALLELYKTKREMQAAQWRSDCERNCRWYIKLLRHQRTFDESHRIADAEFENKHGQRVRLYKRLEEIAEFGQPVEFDPKDFAACYDIIDNNEN